MEKSFLLCRFFCPIHPFYSSSYIYFTEASRHTWYVIRPIVHMRKCTMCGVPPLPLIVVFIYFIMYITYSAGVVVVHCKLDTSTRLCSHQRDGLCRVMTLCYFSNPRATCLAGLVTGSALQDLRTPTPDP